MGRGRRGTKSKRYTSKKRANRRETKRRGRREESKGIELPQSSEHSVQEEHGNKQESTQPPGEVRGEAVVDRSYDGQLTSSQQATEKMKTDYQRLRELLYMEQRRPRIFEKECYRCMRRRNAELAKATNSMREMMFSGKTFGSRYLIAALKKNKMHKGWIVS